MLAPDFGRRGEKDMALATNLHTFVNGIVLVGSYEVSTLWEEKRRLSNSSWRRIRPLASIAKCGATGRRLGRNDRFLFVLEFFLTLVGVDEFVADGAVWIKPLFECRHVCARVR